MSLVIYFSQCLRQRIPFFNCGWEEVVSKYVCRIPFFNCGWEEVVSKYVCRVPNLQELTVMFT